jgi:tRNA threonylcarbamoyladenosine biosynthesis protein TsaB
LQELLEARTGEGIGLVLVGSGPGSYSGTRVGIAAAQGVAVAAECPAVAIPSILAVRSVCAGGACLAIGDARRGSFWSARMDQCRLLSEPELTDTAGLVSLVSAAVAAEIVVVSFEEPARFPLPSDLVSAIRLEFPDAQRLWHAWLQAGDATRERWLLEMPQPIYLKPPHITPAKRSLQVRLQA